MARDPHWIKEGDTRPPVIATLYPDGSDEAPANLEGATVRFHMIDASGEIVVDAPAELLMDGVTGGVRFAGWTSDHTAVAGEYFGEFEVTWPDGSIGSFPKERRGFPILIVKDLA